MQFSSNPESSENTNDQTDDVKDFLDINDTDDQKKRKSKVKHKTGEIPEWAKKFVEAKNIDMHNDVKFAEPA